MENMAHQENYFTFFFPESSSLAKEIPPGFLAHNSIELGYACLKYTLVEKVYLNSLFKPCSTFITRVPSSTQSRQAFLYPCFAGGEPTQRNMIDLSGLH